MRWTLLPPVAVLAMVSALSARAAAPLAEYGKLPAIEQMALSPSGSNIAFVAVEGNARKVVVEDAAGKALFAVAVGDRKLREAEWLDDGHILVGVSSTVLLDASGWVPKGEFMQSSIISLDGAKPFTVFAGEPKIVHATYGFYGSAQFGGHSYGYFGGQTMIGSGNSFIDFSNNASGGVNGYIDLYRVDLDSGHAERVAGGSALFGSDWVVAPDGTIAGVSKYDPRTSEWRLFGRPDAETPIEQIRDPIGDTQLVGLGRTSGSILVQQPQGSGDWQYVEFPSGEPLEGGQSFRTLVYDPRSHLLIGAVLNGDEPKTVLFDPALQAKFDKVPRAFPGEQVELVSATGNLDRMIVETTGPGDSGTYYFVDIAAGSAHAVGWAYPKILQGDVGAVSVVRYKAADGLDEEGVLTLPPGREPKDLPLVVLPHGGPQARDYPGFDWWAQAYASLGYAVFQPNFRGSDGFGKAFRDAGFGQWGRKMQSDISDGVAELARQGIVDPKRACIVGGSYGGYAALAGVTLQHGLYRCAVAVAGVSDLPAMKTWSEQRSGYDSAATRYWREFMGPDAGLGDISPARQAAKADAPVLLIHGRDDTVVPPDQSQRMRDALAAAHKTVELTVLPSEDHWLSRPETRTQMLQASAAFIEKYNPPN
ncbi:MAG TPA: S9 family peptidase [Caulobacteraceae bacterium]|nr:S9 family peptidase [Caulobacteraceae bacterium]